MSESFNGEYAAAQVAKDDAAAAALEKLRSGVNPRLSITGVSNVESNAEDWSSLAEALDAAPEYKVIVGLDWIKVFVFGECVEPVPVCDWFETLQGEARKEHSGGAFFELGGQDCEMKGHPVGIGNNRLEYFFHAGGVDVALADMRPDSDRMKSQEPEKRPIAMIEMKGRFCYGRHWLELLQEIDWWASQLGLSKCEMRLSRLDIAIDVWGRAVQDSEVNRILGGVVTRATDDRTFRSHGKTTGIQYGAGDSATALCIYDKARELRQDPAKLLEFEAAYGELKADDKITRYEYRLRRQGLAKNNNIRTTDDLALRLGGLVKYLTTSWYRETKPDAGERSDERETLPVWKAIGEKAVEAVNGEFLPRERPSKQPAERDQLLKQAVGCITSAAASMNAECQRPEDFLACCYEFLINGLTEKYDLGREKLQRYRAHWADVRSISAPRFADLTELKKKILEERQAECEDDDLPIALRFA